MATPPEVTPTGSPQLEEKKTTSVPPLPVQCCVDCNGPAEKQEGSDLCFYCWYFRIRKTSPDFADKRLAKWYAGTHLTHSPPKVPDPSGTAHEEA